MKRYLLILCSLLFAAGGLVAQRTITGNVTGGDGEPLIGANILVKGSSVGTVSDIDGDYSLEVPANAEVLIFSYLGYTTEEREIGTTNTIDVTLAQGIVLEETVVTALGISKDEKSLGYAVQSVDGSQIQQVGEPDPLRALQGKVPGVNIAGSSGAPGSATRITIRGNSSFLGNNQPLIVVDGIPFDNSEYRTNLQLSQGGAYSGRSVDIDPNNVENINILRGAAASALYGSRAANGVIEITTKTGSLKGKQPLGVSFSSTVSFEQIANLPEYQNSYGTGTNFAYGLVNGSWGAPFIGATPYASLDSIPHWYIGRTGFEHLAGTRVPYRAYPNNVSDLFQTGVSHENSLSLRGGNETSSISATISYMNNEGYVPNTGFDRLNFNVGGNTLVGDKFKAGVNLGYSRVDQRGVISGVGASGSNNPSAFARALYLGRNWDVTGQPYQNPVDLGSEFMVGRGQADNPYWSYENAGFESLVDRINASIFLSYEITSNLSANYRVGMNAYDQGNLEFIRPGSTGPSDNPGVGSIYDHDISFNEIESNLFLQYDKDVSPKLNFSAVLGHNVNQRTYDQQAYRGLGYVVFDIDDLDNTNSVVPYSLPNSLGFERRRLIGVYGDVTLGYDNWAYLNIAARNDWSSTLPIENRSYFYPAASLSVSLLDALDMSSGVFDLVKLRAGWAQVGSDTDPYQLNPIYNVNGFLVTSPSPTAELPFLGLPGSTLSDIARDPNLKPEITTEFEVGTDVRLFRGRVGLDLTYYSRETKDQIAPVTLPESSGFVFSLTNFGVISNKGVEVGLALTPVRTSSGFSWDMYGTFTKNKNVVEELRDGVEEIQIEVGSSFAGNVIGVLRPGEEYGVLLGSADARDDEGNLLIDPSNGQMIRALQPEIIGNPNPDFQVGLTNTFAYKGLFLRAVFDWRQGGDLFSNTVLSMLGRGVTKDTEDRELNRVIPGVYADPTTLEPYLDENGDKIANQTMEEVNTIYFGETFAINGANEWSVYDATFYRLREVTLGFALPKAWMNKLPVQNATLSVTGRNLWFLAPGFPEFTNFDPEVNQYGSSNKQGIEYSATPSTKRYSVNLKLNF